MSEFKIVSTYKLYVYVSRPPHTPIPRSSPQVDTFYDLYLIL